MHYLTVTISHRVTVKQFLTVHAKETLGDIY